VKENPTQVVYQKRRPVLVLRSANLRVIAGPDRGAGCPMTLERVRVGTAEDNALVLSDPQVSRYHLEFRVQDRGYLVCDLQSTNGTFYRGVRIREAELGFGAELRLGGTVLSVEPGSISSEEVLDPQGFGRLIGRAESMQRVAGVLAAVAPTDTTVLIEGETGTGKELVAQQIHQRSPRADRMFAVVDCGALPGGLIESELFGHERGAFTGAEREREGVFERCRGGTVFLDEVGELPLQLQTRLLRVLDQRTVRRVGGDHQRPVDVRLVAATNRNLSEEVGAGRFRGDLFYRLAVVRIVLPPLRERREDIPALARHFLAQAGCFDPEAVLTPEVLEALASRRWPGNVRELRNALERAVVLSEGAEGLLQEDQPIEPATPPAGSQAPFEASPPAGGWLGHALPAALFRLPYKELKNMLVEELQNLYIGRLLQRHGKNISRIAEEAQVDRHLVRRVLQRLEEQER
jgi:DNA-binding NtrC family response regulator